MPTDFVETGTERTYVHGMSSRRNSPTLESLDARLTALEGLVAAALRPAPPPAMPVGFKSVGEGLEAALQSYAASMRADLARRGMGD